MSLEDYQFTQTKRSWYDHVKPEDQETLKKWAVQYKQRKLTALQIQQAIKKEYPDLKVSEETIRHWMVKHGGNS